MMQVKMKVDAEKTQGLVPHAFAGDRVVLRDEVAEELVAMGMAEIIDCDFTG
jgi:hypothetical protein